jgi:hypothetical protein
MSHCLCHRCYSVFAEVGALDIPSEGSTLVYGLDPEPQLVDEGCDGECGE